MKLLLSVDELDLSVRGANCLKTLKIRYIGDLVQRTPAELLRTRNFGRKTLVEIQKQLAELDLRLNMELPEWSPELINEIKKKFAENLTALRRDRAKKLGQRIYGTASTLEDELSSLAKLAGSDRNSRIVTKYFGWTGDGTTNLEAVA